MLGRYRNSKQCWYAFNRAGLGKVYSYKGFQDLFSYLERTRGEFYDVIPSMICDMYKEYSLDGLGEKCKKEFNEATDIIIQRRYDDYLELRKEYKGNTRSVFKRIYSEEINKELILILKQYYDLLMVYNQGKEDRVIIACYD